MRSFVLVVLCLVSLGYGSESFGVSECAFSIELPAKLKENLEQILQDISIMNGLINKNISIPGDEFSVEPSAEIKAIAEAALTNSGLSDKNISIIQVPVVILKHIPRRSLIGWTLSLSDNEHYIALPPVLDGTRYTQDLITAIAYHECGHISNYGIEHDIDMQPKERVSLGSSLSSSLIAIILSFTGCAKNLDMQLEPYWDKLPSVTWFLIVVAHFLTQITDDLPYLAYQRDFERQADMFACEKLYKLRNFEPLLAMLYCFQKLARQSLDDLVERFSHLTLSTYPSFQERSLLIRQFLKNKGIDVDQALSAYLKKAIPNGEDEVYFFKDETIMVSEQS